MTYLGMQFGSLPVAKAIITYLQKNSSMTDKEILAHAIGWSNTSMGIIAVIIVMALLHSNKKYLSTVFKGKKETLGKAVLWGIAGFFFAMFGQMIAGMIEMALFNTEPGSDNTAMLSNIAKASPIIIIMIVFIAPFLEEVVFRRVLFGSIYQKTNFWVAAIISGVIFAAVHNELEHLIVYMAPGLIFAFIYYRTKRLIAPIISHLLMNGFVIIVQFNYDKIMELQKTIPAFIQFWMK